MPATPFFLCRESLVDSRQQRLWQMRSSILRRGQSAVRVRQSRGLFDSFLKTKSRDQIAKRLPPPIADIWFPHTGEFLQELQHRGVIEGLAANPSSRRPGRDNDARHTKSSANRHAVHELARGAGRRDWRRYVIENPVIFVVVQNECSLCPNLGIGCNGVNFAGHEGGACGGHVIRVL